MRAIVRGLSWLALFCFGACAVLHGLALAGLITSMQATPAMMIIPAGFLFVAMPSFILSRWYGVGEIPGGPWRRLGIALWIYYGLLFFYMIALAPRQPGHPNRQLPLDEARLFSGAMMAFFFLAFELARATLPMAGAPRVAPDEQPGAKLRRLPY